MDTEVQIQFSTVAIGDELDPISISITLQRLVMEAGANRDFSLIHHDREVAQATGAADAYANTFFIAGMFERLLREWMGMFGKLNKISNLRMSTFNVVGDTMTFAGRVADMDAESGQIAIELWAQIGGGRTVTANATVTLPQ